MSKTLAESLKPASVDWNTLHNQYNPLLNLVRELIGIIPNCDPTLEIWPPGFRTYNLLVPNMFNLPNTLFGSKLLKASMGLAMYAASKAECAYCTAHTCSFALRRGTNAKAILGSRTPQEQSVVVLAEKLASVPSTLTKADILEVRKYFSPTDVEWLVYSISMMGFLNKFMNAMGIELEQEAINDVGDLLSKTGWTPGIHAGSDFKITNSTTPQKDNLFTYLRVLRHAPGAVMWENKWTKSVPSTYREAADYLRQHTGYSFPILKPVKESRVVRTLTTALRDNLDKESTVSGLKIKMYAGNIFSAITGNDLLKSEIRNMSMQIAPEMNDELFNRLQEIAQMEVPADDDSCNKSITSFQKLGLSEKEAALLLLAVASSHSPSQVNEAVIKTTLKHVKPAATVEIVAWLSVLQLLGRMSSYYQVVNSN
jgi:alkylhydroperoxidase family enzyme